jgi:hypothetical protein
VKRALRASCALLKPVKCQRSKAAPSYHDQGQRRRPQRGYVEPVEAAREAGEQRLARPERRQQRRDRRLQRGEEVGDVGQRLDPQQPLGLDEAQQHHEAHREQQAHQHQDVARAFGGNTLTRPSVTTSRAPPESARTARS